MLRKFSIGSSCVHAMFMSYITVTLTSERSLNQEHGVRLYSLLVALCVPTLTLDLPTYSQESDNNVEFLIVLEQMVSYHACCQSSCAINSVGEVCVHSY